MVGLVPESNDRFICRVTYFIEIRGFSGGMLMQTMAQPTNTKQRFALGLIANLSA